VPEFRPASTIYRKVGPKAPRIRRTLIGRPMGEQNSVEQNRTRTAPGNTLPPSGGPTSVIAAIFFICIHKIQKDNNSKPTKTKRNANLKLMNNLKLKQTMNELTADLQLTQQRNDTHAHTTQTRCFSSGPLAPLMFFGRRGVSSSILWGLSRAAGCPTSRRASRSREPELAWGTTSSMALGDDEGSAATGFLVIGPPDRRLGAFVERLSLCPDGT
jgi:hypothetical protein